jgi:hypothetical protein
MSADDRAEARTLAQHAEAAEQAVRALNHRTRPAVGELADPAETAGMIAALAVLAGMLPQLLDQLRCWLLDEHHAGRLRVDSCTPMADAGPRQAVQATATALAHAAECTRRAGHALDTAHQHAAHLAVAVAGNDPERCQR